MPRSKPHKAKDKGEISTPSTLSAIKNCLKDMQRTYPQKELTEEEVEHWVQDLSPFPARAIDWAFDNWRRNGRFFPVYGDILDQCITWAPPEQTHTKICDAECKSRHGRGYGEMGFAGMHDITRLQELVRRKIVAEKRTVDQVLTDSEIDMLLDQLDELRGSSPDWRKQRVIA